MFHCILSQLETVIAHHDKEISESRQRLALQEDLAKQTLVDAQVEHRGKVEQVQLTIPL